MAAFVLDIGRIWVLEFEGGLLLNCGRMEDSSFVIWSLQYSVFKKLFCQSNPNSKGEGSKDID